MRMPAPCPRVLVAVVSGRFGRRQQPRRRASLPLPLPSAAAVLPPCSAHCIHATVHQAFGAGSPSPHYHAWRWLPVPVSTSLWGGEPTRSQARRPCCTDLTRANYIRRAYRVFQGHTPSLACYLRCCRAVNRRCTARKIPGLPSNSESPSTV